MNFLELVKARYSCRKMSDKPVETEKLDQILETAIAAPTAKNLQPFKIWVLKSNEAMEKVKQATHFTFGANTVLIVGGKADDAFTRPVDGKNFAEIDATIVATHLLLAIEDAGLATTWVGMVEEAKLKELFPEMVGYDIVALFPLGYAADDAKPSPRHTERRSQDELVSVL